MITFNILVLCAFVAVVRSQAVNVEHYYTTHNNSVLHVDYFLDAHRRQHASIIWFYNYQIDVFKTLYTERINALIVQQNALVDSLVQIHENLYPMELLSDFRKDCVEKYKSLITPVSAAKFNMESCISTAKSQLNSLIANPSSTNRTLDSYYLNTFEKAAQTCQKNYPAAELNYTICVQNAVSAANVYTINNQKTFDTQMDSAASSAQVYVKKAFQCGYGVQNGTIASSYQGTTLIDRCFQGLDNCNSCSGYFCDNVYYIPSSSIDSKNQSMKNVFYGNNANLKCLMLDVY